MPPIAPDAEELTVTTGGKKLGGWQNVRVTRGVELLPSHFEIELTERFPGQISKVVVDPTATCTVALSGDLVLTGYIDRYQPAYDKSSHRVRIIGRSKTQDLVDCAINVTRTGLNSFMIKAKTVGQVAKIVCDSYGIGVSLPNGDADLPGPLRAFHIDPGLTAYALLEEMARSVGMLIWDDELGRLVISKGGTGGRAGSAIVEGKNAERVEANLTADQRFAEYMVLGQGQSQAFGFVNYSAHAFDPEKDKLRNRLRIIPQELPDPGESHSKKRAQWEANRRYGRSRLARVIVTGWAEGSGALWWPNKVVAVDLPTAKIKGDRVISEVVWQRGENGTQTILTLMPPEALEVQPFTIAPPVSLNK